MAYERFSVTFDVATPESAEYGDFSESGFASPGGWRRVTPDNRSAWPWRVSPGRAEIIHTKHLTR
jgi:hypothetical protein